jgi:O-antigen biosynthesis protein
MDPEISVAMPAWNAGRFIREAISSVLAQDGIRLELIVVDDASTDDTAALVAAFDDPRVRHVRNDRRRGVGYCHNAALGLARANLIAHVDADDTLLPGALIAMADAASGPGVGQAYCDFHTIDETGAATADSLAAWQDFFARQRRKPIDYPRELLVHGMVVNHLRTYPRHVFDRVGAFDERLTYAIDYDMALRIAEHFTFAHVPRQLYAKRTHSKALTEGMRLKSLRFWLMRRRIARRRSLQQGGVVLGASPARRRRLMALSLAYALGAGPVIAALSRVDRRRGDTT